MGKQPEVPEDHRLIQETGRKIWFGGYRGESSKAQLSYSKPINETVASVSYVVLVNAEGDIWVREFL